MTDEFRVEVEGSGELGEIGTGWSVQEYATPIIIGDTAGGTGQVSFTASAKEDSLFVVNNNITSSFGSLGEVSGVARTVSQTGNVVSVSHGTRLSLLDGSFNVPALGAGGAGPVLDLALQVSGADSRCLLPSGFFYSMAGHSAGFNALNEIAKPKYSEGSYEAYSQETADYYPVYWRTQFGSLWADDFSYVDGKVYALNVRGDSFSNDPGVNVSRLAVKVNLFTDLHGEMNALPSDSNTDSGQQLSLDISSSGVATLNGSYYSGGTLQFFSASTNLADQLTLAGDIVVFIEYVRGKTFGSEHTLRMWFCDEGNYDNFIEISETYIPGQSQYFAPWAFSGLTRGYYRDQGAFLDAWAPVEYEDQPSYVVDLVDELRPPVPAIVDRNLWEWVQDACSAYSFEVGVVNGSIIARDIDARVLQFDNHTLPTITPTIALTGRNVEVVYSNARHVVSGEVYNAREDNNRVISVKAAESITTTVTVDGSLADIQLPKYSTTPMANAGEYKVSDANGNPIPIDLFNDKGGRVIVKLSDAAPNAIDITFVGPNTSDNVFGPSGAEYPEPYKIAYVADGTDYAALSILGTGVLSKPKTLKIRTAADVKKTVQDVARTITNPFVNTLQQAYDRGVFAAIEASGPKVSLSGSVSYRSLEGFGLTAGSRIYYRDSIYRVNDVTINGLSVSFNASRHVTVDDFDDFWSGRTVGIHDDLWAGYDASDHLIRPLWFIGDDEGVVLIIDEDGNPAYMFTGDTEFTIFIDEDGKPYYEFGDLENGELVYLDSDGIPYV